MDSSSEEAGKMSWAKGCFRRWSFSIHISWDERIKRAINDALGKAAEVAEDSSRTHTSPGKDCAVCKVADAIRALMESP